MIDPNHTVARIRAGVARRHEMGLPIAADGLEGELNSALAVLAELREYADSMPTPAYTHIPARAETEVDTRENPIVVPDPAPADDPHAAYRPPAGYQIGAQP